jgi:hypothetical protein
MKKFIALFLAASSAILADTTIGFGYREKDITFGKLSSGQGAYTASVEAKYGSFRGAALVQNNLSLKDSSLYQTDLLAGYSFTSTLVDVELGGKYLMKGKPALTDIGSHWRPFVTLSKGWFSVRGMMDLESQTSNIEASVTDKRPVFGGIKAITGLYVGYTDANDALPRSRKEIKYTNAYYGGSFDLGWKFLTAGIYVLKNDFATAWTAGWRVGVTQKF